MPLAPMAEARAAPIAAVMQHTLLVAGGAAAVHWEAPGGASWTAECLELRDEARGAWRALPPMREARWFGGSAVLGECWYYSLTHSLSLSLSHTHTRTHARTHTCICMHARTHTCAAPAAGTRWAGGARAARR